MNKRDDITMSNSNRPLRLNNDWCVKKLVYETSQVETFCPLGQDHCTLTFRIMANVNRYIFDHDVLDDWIAENISGKQFTMEQAGYTLYHYLLGELQPEQLTVQVLWNSGTAMVEI